MKMAIITFFAFFVGVSTASAIPALQLYIDGALYDEVTESWVITDTSDFEFYVVGDPCPDDGLFAAGHCLLEDVYLIISTDSEMEPDDTIEIDGQDYPVGNWAFGSPDTEPQFPPHDIFPAWFFMLGIGEFAEIGGIGNVVPDSAGWYFDPSGGYVDSSIHIGEIRRFDISIPEGITNIHIDAVSLADNQRLIFAPFSHDAGYFDPESYPPTGIDNINPNVPSKIVLLESYPNPFNSETTIRFSLPAASEISLILYDLQGRHVNTLAMGVFDAGVRSVVWDGKNDAGQPVASGVYLIKLTAPGTVISRNVLLLK